MKIYGDQDADLSILGKKTITTIGGIYRLSWRDSGLNVIVGVQPEGISEWDDELRAKATAEGFKVYNVDEAVKKGDIIVVFTHSDAEVADVYKNYVAPNLSKGKALVVYTGLHILYGLINPPKDVDVVMLAPKSPINPARVLFTQGGGVPALIAIHNDYTGNAKQIALALAKAAGFTRAGVGETTFKDEMETDFAGEQFGWAMLFPVINGAFELLLEYGYEPELAYWELCHELKFIEDLIYVGGFEEFVHNISDTALFGVLSRADKIYDNQMKEKMRKVMDEIRSGKFVSDWVTEMHNGLPMSRAFKRRVKDLPIEQVGKKLREKAKTKYSY